MNGSGGGELPSHERFGKMLNDHAVIKGVIYKLHILTKCTVICKGIAASRFLPCPA